MGKKPEPQTKPAHLRDLTPDPKNARKHNPRNVGMLVDALQEVGAARSIVIDEEGVVLAGNATIEAAAEAGITKVVTVDADGETLVAVRRTGLTPEQKTRLALYDNRVAELADWDESVLTELRDEGHLAGLFDEESEAKGTAELIQLDTKPAPRMVWVLIGVPTVRYGEFDATIRAIGETEGVICETTVADE